MFRGAYQQNSSWTGSFLFWFSPAEEEIGQLNDAAGGPAHGVAETHQERGIRDEVGHHKQVDLPDSDEGQQHDHHRSPGVAPAPERAGQHVVHAVEQQEEAVGPDKNTP